MTPHTAFGIRLKDGLKKSTSVTTMYSLPRGKNRSPACTICVLAHAVSFCPGQNPILGPGLKGNWILRGLDREGVNWFALQFAGQAHVASGQWDEAIAKFERAVRSSGEVPYTIGLLGNALARAGRRDEALQQLAKLRTRAESHYVPAIALAYVHAGLNEWDEAFALLGQALEARDHWLTFSLTHFPVLDDLRPDARFKALVARIGL